MYKLTLLQPCNIMQSTIEAETLEEALKLKPHWMYPLANQPFLWTFRGEKSGDATLLKTSWFAEHLNPVILPREKLRPALLLHWLNRKFQQMRQM